MQVKSKRELVREKMYDRVRRQLESGESESQFCKEEKIDRARFSYWRKKYLAEDSKNNSNNFVALKIKEREEQSYQIEIQLPNKIVLRSKAWQSDGLCELIQELQQMGMSC